MDYEKKYKEALELMKDCIPDKNGLVHIRPCDIFSELKESEDEKFKQELIEYHKAQAFLDGKPNNKHVKFVAWLEKQGEQKPVDKILIGKKYKCIASPRYSTFVKGFIYKPEDKFLCRLMNFCSDCFEPIEDGEQKPSESSDIKNVLLVHDEILNNLFERYKTSATFKTFIVNLQNWWNNTRRHLLSLNIEQNPAWSEEDETGLGDALWAIKQARTIAKDENDMGNLWYAERWLNSLKGRIQPKQEWSEEDIVAIDCAVEVLGKDLPSLAASIERLKSLRPQNKWKPSESDIRILEQVIGGTVNPINYHATLYAILEQLKKLREE